MLIMNQIKRLRELEKLSYFDKNTLSQVIELSDNSLYANIKRWLNNGDLIPLKKGMYVTREYYLNLSNKEGYAEFVANKLREPSYLSLESVLQKQNILTEAIFAFTSITLKATRTYKNKFGTFIYRNIKETLFTGYDIRQQGPYEIREASKAKAVFDYLYLKSLRIQDINDDFLDSLRLNLDEFTSKNMDEFSKYCDQAGIKKFKKLPLQLRRLRDF